ncbi:MAG: hypothetical protein M3Y50_07335 [Acidobacteriota bacterium]|nr:hypothetical protein [Acidobacteriota bacterium]
MMKILLLLGLVLPVFGQSIPSDAAKLSTPELTRFMKIVCPGHAKDAQTCTVCPADSDFPNDEQGWQLSAITFGHFTAPGEKEAIVTTIGCNSHASSLGGSFLLREVGHGYQKVWYRPGYIASDCKKLKATDGRDVLVCESSDMHQGVADEFLYLLDLNWHDPQAGWPNRIFFTVLDSLGSCVAMNDGYAMTGHIKAVSFLPHSDAEKVGLLVKARGGRALLPQKILDDCNLNSKPGADEYKPVIATKPLTFQFVFDGSKVLPAPGNPGFNGTEPIMPVSSYFVPEANHPVKLRR